MVKNKILVITGMHFSGTSVVAEWLNKCGLHMGDELLRTSAGSDTGYFEDDDFLNSHKSILKVQRLSDNGFTENPPKEITHEEKDILRGVINYKNGINHQWGWKDPRTCLFLDAYRQIIPEAFYLIVFRDYQSTVNSLIMRLYHQTEKKYAEATGFTRFMWERVHKKGMFQSLCKKYCQHYLKVWIAYNEAILQHTSQLSGTNFIVADYAALYRTDKLIFRQLEDAWNFSLKFSPFKTIYNESFLNKSFDIDMYIKDKSLVSRAMEIESMLESRSNFYYKKPALMAV